MEASSEAKQSLLATCTLITDHLDERGNQAVKLVSLRSGVLLPSAGKSGFTQLFAVVYLQILTFLLELVSLIFIMTLTITII